VWSIGTIAVSDIFPGSDHNAPQESATSSEGMLLSKHPVSGKHQCSKKHLKLGLLSTRYCLIRSCFPLQFMAASFSPQVAGHEKEDDQNSE